MDRRAPLGPHRRGDGILQPASTGLLPAIVPAKDLQQANGLRATAMSAGEIAGPVAAGALVASAGAGWALAVDAATFALSALLLARLRSPAREPRAVTPFVADLLVGWQAFRRRTWVWAIVGSAALSNVVWGAWSVLGPVVAADDFGGAAAWGAILAAMGVGALIGGIGSIHVRPRRPLVVTAWAFAAFAVPLAMLAAGGPAALVALGAMVAGIGMMLGNAVWESTLQRHIPDESLSRVSAYDWFGSLAFAPVGMIVWGPVAAAIGVSASLWTAAAVLAVLSLGVLGFRDVRTLPAAPRDAGVSGDTTPAVR